MLIILAKDYQNSIEKIKIFSKNLVLEKVSLPKESTASRLEVYIFPN